MARNSAEQIVLIETFGKRQTAREDKDFDGERNLSISCHELRYLRSYLMIVGQWYPQEWTSIKKNLFHVWQALVTFGVWAYFFYSFGCLGSQTLEQQYLRWFPISAIEGIVWESRWVVSHHLGLYYFCHQRHLERFLEESSLNQALWKETSRYLKRLCVVVIVFVLVVPVALHPAELSYSINPGDIWEIILDTVVLALNRLVTAPVFLVFIFVAYVVVRVVKGFVLQITRWPKNYKSVEGCGMRAARLHFRKIKQLIGSVGNAFQLYLSLHFFSLLLTIFLGVFACAEQLNAKVNANHTYYYLGHTAYYRRINVKPAAVMPSRHVNMVPLHTGPAKSPAFLPFQELTREQLVNKTEKDPEPGSYNEAGATQMMTEVGIEAVLKILESIILYMVPLTLMLRLQTKLQLVRQAVLDLDCFEQRDNGYLFQDEKSKRTLEEYLNTCTGFTIFGYKMPLFRAFLLSVIAPFVTALTKFLFSYVRVKPR